MSRFSLVTKGYIPSILISSLLAGVILSIAVLIWAKYPPFPDFIESLNSVHESLVDIVEGLLMIFFYVFLLTSIALAREYTRTIAGWSEVIFALIIVLIITFAMFGWVVSLITLIGMGLMTFYFHYIQEEKE